jgi:phosphate transport system permease protein
MAVSAPDKAQTSLKTGSTSRGDQIFKGLTVVFATLLFLLVVAFALVLIINSGQSIGQSGLSFFTGVSWNPSGGQFGALVFVYDSLFIAVIALIIGGAVSLGVAIFLSEYAPDWLRTPISFVIELLAAIPSVIYGLWGVIVLATILGQSLDQFLFNTFAFVPLFHSNLTLNGHSIPVTPLTNGRNLFTASIVLAIMIIPTVASISRDVLRTVPDSQREGMLAMGATKWQTIRRAVLPVAQRGIIGALILGFGRAVGETVAVSYLVGGAQNNIGPTSSIFQRGETIASKIANSYGEVADPISFSAIIELGLVLFVVTLITNALAVFLVKRASKVGGNTNRGVGYWIGRLIFPIVILLLIPYLSWIVSLIIVVLWAAFQFLKVTDVRSQEAGKPLPHFLRSIAQPNISFSYRKIMNRIMAGLMVFATLLAIVPLVSILALIIINGVGAVLQTDFLIRTQDGRLIWDQYKAQASGNTATGIANAVLGTLAITGLSALIGVPIGLLAGIYLSEYGNNRFGDAVRFTADMLISIPSIIIGVFGFAVLVNNNIFANSYNGWDGTVVLAIMIIPIVARTTEEVLRLVPSSLREAALALGLPQWKVTLTTVLPAATSAVVTGIILAVARIAGETAPLILTASTSSNWLNPMSGPTTTLTSYIYNYIKGDQEQVKNAWGAAFVLVFIIFLLVFGIRFLTRSRLRTSM